jgi:hypothetical protein
VADAAHDAECKRSILEGVALERSKPRAMTEHEASRTLVKSPPELWAECSDAASLARHLGQFGEIRITRLEPETAVAWEGENASGTVRLEPSGWGTRVILTARQTEPPNVPAPPEAPPISEAAPALSGAPGLDSASGLDLASGLVPASGPLPPAPRNRLLGRLFGFLRRAPTAPARLPAPLEPTAVKPPTVEPLVEEPAAVKIPAVEPPVAEPGAAELPVVATIDSRAALDCALDSLGQAHHRPFSRA